MYATVSLPDSVLIIGGSDSTNPTYDIDSVAEFKVRAHRTILSSLLRGSNMFVYPDFSPEKITLGQKKER